MVDVGAPKSLPHFRLLALAYAWTSSTSRSASVISHAISRIPKATAGTGPLSKNDPASVRNAIAALMSGT